MFFSRLVLLYIPKLVFEVIVMTMEKRVYFILNCQRQNRKAPNVTYTFR